MSVSSESAEQLMKLYIDETEFVLKISGTAIKNVATALYVISKDTSSKTGKTRLKNMLKSENGIKMFSIKKKDMETFVKEAKSYGILYYVIKNKDIQNKDTSIDIMIRTEDAPQVNYLVEKFKLDTVDKATIENATKEIGERKETGIEVEKEEIVDSMIDDIFATPSKEQENELPLIDGETEIDIPLENSLMNKDKSEEIIKTKEKESVKKQIKEIGEEKKKQQKKLEIEKAKNIPTPIESEKILKNERGIIND